MAVGAVVARILTQYSDKGSKAAQRDILKLGKTFDAYAKKATKAVGIVAAASAAAAVKIGKDSVMAASDVAQQFGALDAVFAGNAEQLKSFSRGMVEYGLSTADAARYAALLGTQLKGLGLSEQDAIDRTKTLEILAADLAATYGGTTADAVQALSSTFKGEYNPIERYGVAIRKSDITARVAAKGLKGLTGEALKAAEAQAAYELILNKTSAAQGQAGREYNTLAAQLQRLRASFTNVEATLGTALLPVVQQFTGYLISDVIPLLEYWVFLNQDRIANSLESLVGNIKEVVVAFTNIYNIIDAINNLLPIGIGGWIQLAVAIKGLTLVGSLFATALQMYSLRLSLLTGSMQIFGKSTDSVKTILGSSANNTMKMILLADKLKLALLGTAAAGTKLGIALRFIGKMMLALLPKPIWLLFAAMTAVYTIATKVFKVGQGPNKLSDAAQKAAFSMYQADQATTSMDDALNAYRKTQDSVVKKTKEQLQAERDAAAQKAKDAAATARQEAAEKKRSIVLARLKKLSAVPGQGKAKIGKGITPVSSIEAAEYDAINFRAAELLLLKQKDNQVEIERLKALKEGVFLAELRNTLAERYKDILTALADAKIDNKDISTLAGIWGVTEEAAKAYIETVFAISDGTISDDEITKLAMSWGSTKEQAAQYLEFFQALNDGILSDAEIEKLKAKWGLTEQQVRQYADFVGVVNDGKLTDVEIQKLMTKWKMTTDEVVAYIIKIGSPVSYSGTLIDPALAAELAWKNATAALEEYLRKLAMGTGAGPGGGPAYDPKASADANKEAADAWAAAQDAAKEAAEANSDATKAALDAAALVMKMAAEVEATTLKLESGKKFLTDAQMDAVLTTGGSVYGTGRTDSSVFADERSKFQGMYNISPTLSTASTIGTSSSSAPVVVNLTVNGSVSTEQDLVQSVRQGLLAAQTNGNSITLQAI